MKRAFKLIAALGAVALMGSSECDPAPATTAKNTQAQKAAEAANSIRFTENAEIENIKKRLELTSQPGLLGFIVLLNDMGQPVMYAATKGKITSSGKRLTKPYEVHDIGGNSTYVFKDLPAPSDEGTWGSSGEYVYFWTVSGQYVQWNGHYLYSDKPFRLNVRPLVIDVEAK